MLTLENVNVYYGGIHALRDVSLRVEFAAASPP
jgi:ABC-type branched-subunit amino acid transport system ATPase component